MVSSNDRKMQIPFALGLVDEKNFYHVNTS